MPIVYKERRPIASEQEADLRQIELEDDNPVTGERMVSYMYTFDYKDE
jgi:hypothetical protein